MLHTQSNSAAADAYVSQHPGPIDVTTLVLYEFRQGVHFQAWPHRNDCTKGYSIAEARDMLARLEENLALGIFHVLPVDWTAVHSLASDLALLHTQKAGACGFDLLHVATAAQLKVARFLSFDAAQRDVAQQCGLEVAPQ